MPPVQRINGKFTRSADKVRNAYNDDPSDNAFHYGFTRKTAGTYCIGYRVRPRNLTTHPYTIQETAVRTRFATLSAQHADAWQNNPTYKANTIAAYSANAHKINGKTYYNPYYYGLALLLLGGN